MNPINKYNKPSSNQLKIKILKEKILFKVNQQLFKQKRLKLLKKLKNLWKKSQMMKKTHNNWKKKIMYQKFTKIK